MLIAKDFMTPQVIGISKDATIRQATEVLHLKEVSGLIVTSKKKPVGIVTERDIVKFISEGGDPDKTVVKSIMSSPVTLVPEDEPLGNIITNMADTKFKRLPVVKDEKIVGIISQSDVLRNIVRIGQDLFGKLERGEIEEKEFTKKHKMIFMHLQPITNTKAVISWHMHCIDCNKAFFMDEIAGKLVKDECPFCHGKNIEHVK